MEDFEIFAENSHLIAHGSIEALEKAFPSKRTLQNLRLGELGLSLLHLAAWFDRPDICKYLIDSGIDPNVQESCTLKTPLHIASYLGHIECASSLIKNGASPFPCKESVDKLGCSPLQYAAMSGNREMIDFLMEISHPERVQSENPLCPVRLVSWVGNILGIFIRKKNRDLLDRYSLIGAPHAVETNPQVFSGTYIGYLNEYQWTPFHFAAAMGDTKAIYILLKHFPDASCLKAEYQRKYKFSPGEVALAEGHAQSAKLLGVDEEIQSFREKMKAPFFGKKGSPDYMVELMDAIVERDQIALNSLLKKYGSAVLEKECFESQSDDYLKRSNLTPYSIACRTFAFSFLNGLVEKGINIPQNEFLGGSRDIVEIPFFNWCLMDVNPYGEGFFKSLKSSLPLSKSA